MQVGAVHARDGKALKIPGLYRQAGIFYWQMDFFDSCNRIRSKRSKLFRQES
jgi:hypothetical protein